MSNQTIPSSRAHVSEKITPRPNIGQLEDLLNRTDEGEIEVLPNGDVDFIPTIRWVLHVCLVANGRSICMMVLTLTRNPLGVS